MPPLTGQKERSVMDRLPAGRRTECLNRISANANQPGGSTKYNQIGRAQQAACQRLAGTMGIYVIEIDRTGSLAYSVGGAIPASITVEGGTPASAVVVAGTPPAPPPLIPVTWAGAATVSLTVQVTPTLVGNAKFGVAV